MAIDRMDWHYGGNFPEDLPNENGGTHIGIFLAWIINNNLEGDLHKEESAEALEDVRKRKITGRDFLIDQCDEKFWEEDLTEEGFVFAESYYENDYHEDYEETLIKNLPTTYHVEDTWENYDKIAQIIDKRFREWKNEL